MLLLLEMLVQKEENKKKRRERGEKRKPTQNGRRVESFAKLVVSEGSRVSAESGVVSASQKGRQVVALLQIAAHALQPQALFVQQHRLPHVTQTCFFFFKKIKKAKKIHKNNQLGQKE